MSPPPAKQKEPTLSQLRAKEVLDRLRQEKKSRQKEKELIKRNIAAMKRRAQEERAKVQANKEVISEADLRQSVYQEQIQLKRFCNRH